MRENWSRETVRYSVAEVSRLVGVSPATIRVWEREGLVSPRRTPGGHRGFSAADVERLRRVSSFRKIERLNAAAIRRELGAAEPPDPADAEPRLGPRLRAARRERGLTLAAVAERTGLSVSFLSAVERGQAGISLGNLIKIATTLRTPLPTLQTSSERRDGQPMPLDPRPRYVGKGSKLVMEDLVNSPGSLQAQRFEIAPGGGCDQAYSHPGEEFIYVLSGRLTFWIDEREEYQLVQNDSLHLLSTRLHRWRNGGDDPAVVLWVVSWTGEAGGDGLHADAGPTAIERRARRSSGSDAPRERGRAQRQDGEAHEQDAHGGNGWLDLQQ